MKNKSPKRIKFRGATYERVVTAVLSETELDFLNAAYQAVDDLNGDIAGAEESIKQSLRAAELALSKLPDSYKKSWERSLEKLWDSIEQAAGTDLFAMFAESEDLLNELQRIQDEVNPA